MHKDRKIQDIGNKTPKYDAFSTITQLNCALKVFGLSCIYRDGAKLAYNSPIWKFVVYIVVFFGANAYSVYFKLQSHETYTKFTFMDAMQLAYLLAYIQYIFDIICVYKYGRQTNIDYFNLYDYIDGILGTPYYKEIKKSIRNMCVFFIFIGATTIIIELCTWTVHFNWTVVNIYSIELIYIAIRMLADLDIIGNYIQVRFRLKTIGDILEYHYYNADNFPGVIKNVIYDKVSLNFKDYISQDVRKFNPTDPLRTTNNPQDIMSQLSRCYTLLIEQADFINLKCGIRVLVCCSLYLLDMVLYLNTIIRISMGTMVFLNAPGYLIVLSTTSRLLAFTVMVFCGIHSCEQTYRETERIIRLIDHLLIGKKITKELRETITKLKALIISRPIIYHALNFFRLDYGTFVSMLSVIITYTIILLQNLQ